MSVLAASPIATARLDLLPLRVEHAEEMAGALSDPALHAFIGGSPDTPRALRSRYRRLTAGSPDPAVSWLNWVILLREESCLTGTVQATVTSTGDGDGHGDGDGSGAVAEIAWVVGTPWQARGIASEAARGLVGLLARRDVHTVVAHIHPEHLASAAVARAAGLAPTGAMHEGEIRWQRRIE